MTHAPTAFDLIVIGIVGLSTVLAVWRGFVRVVVSLLTWVVALVAAVRFSDVVDPMLPAFAGGAVAHYVAAFVLILVVVLLVGSLAGWVLAKLVRAAGLGLLDRLLGAVLGMARGLLIVVLGVLLAGFTSLPRQDWWQNALSAPPLVAAALSLRPWLPKAWANRLDYGAGARRSASPGARAKLDREMLFQGEV